MPDYSNPNSLTLIFGQSSSGKTSLAFAYLLNVPAAVVLIFDDGGQASRRLKIKPCADLDDCEKALSTRIVCFNPYLRYPGSQVMDAFRWFLSWSYQISQRGPGRKVLFVDELWQWSDNRHAVPPELQNIVRTGRHHGLEFITATHNPREYHELIRSQATEFIAFNTIEPAQLDSIRPYWSGVDAASKLPRGQFLALNRNSGATVSGMMEPGWPPGRFIKVP